MANLASVLKDEIRRLARREINSQMGVTKKSVAQHRRDIAELKRQLADKERRIAFLERHERKRAGKTPTRKLATGARFSAKGLRSHRERLGLSAEDFGKLIGVVGQSVYMWEQEKTRPRAAQLAAIVEVRGLGRREALKRLDRLEGV